MRSFCCGWLADDQAANQSSIRDAEVAHFDESGMRIDGDDRDGGVRHRPGPSKARKRWTPLASCCGSTAPPFTTTGNPTGPTLRPFALQRPSPSRMALWRSIDRTFLAYRPAPYPGGRPSGGRRRPYGFRTGPSEWLLALSDQPVKDGLACPVRQQSGEKIAIPNVAYRLWGVLPAKAQDIHYRSSTPRALFSAFGEVCCVSVVDVGCERSPEGLGGEAWIMEQAVSEESDNNRTWQWRRALCSKEVLQSSP